MDNQPGNPLHGVTLKALLELLVERHGWEFLARKVNVNCFRKDPSIGSSLAFLRKQAWAREKVERIYLGDLARGLPGVTPRTRGG